MECGCSRPDVGARALRTQEERRAALGPCLGGRMSSGPGGWQLLSLLEKTMERTGCLATASVSESGYAWAIEDLTEGPVCSEVLRRIALPQTESTGHW
ncbi:hypothetical protein NDU88_005843 [Pleurodeles waltl]|uniref:Uncharacterized protein n=1 Tax=Pleurodeles waltl TaxID=8319 RepID=A0AAV7NNZ1_PLEWA|nr:hypothetical protein NDU88_005843 [Pleurodeles waltl]